MRAQSWFIEWAIPGLGMFCEVRLPEGPLAAQLHRQCHW